MKTWVFRLFLIATIASNSLGFACAQSVSPSDSSLGLIGTGIAPRKLASGVMTVVSPDQNSEDTALGPFDLELVDKHPELAWTAPDFPENKPHFASPSETLVALSRDVVFRHDVWGLEFAFKPARLIEVDLPVANGQMQRKVVWYMVYKIRYTGDDLVPIIAAEVPSTPKKVKVDSVRFIPRFSLLSKERNLNIDARILPTALDAIAAKERVGKRLYDHIEISKLDIAVSNSEEDNSVWGVATWTDVDPSVDFFAIDVRGLTNAYKIRIDAEGKSNFDGKTLRIYHWRPGDALDESKDRIYLGLPAYISVPKESPMLKDRRSGLISRLNSRKSEWSQFVASGKREKAEEIASELLNLQNEIAGLDTKLRMQDALDHFNLKERLDYQWIYR